MELWDAYNKDYNKVGIDLVRGDKIPNGLFHLVVGVIVKHADGSYLITTRDPIKEPWPGYDEIGAGGSAVKGEDALTAAKRELEEETGLVAYELIEIKTTIQEEYNTICASFLYLYNGDKNCIKLQKGENVAYKWISKEQLYSFINSDKCIQSQKLRLSDFLKSKYFD